MSEQELMDKLDKMFANKRTGRLTDGSNKGVNGHATVRKGTNHFLASRKRRPQLPRAGQAFTY